MLLLSSLEKIRKLFWNFIPTILGAGGSDTGRGDGAGWGSYIPFLYGLSGSHLGDSEGDQTSQIK